MRFRNVVRRILKLKICERAGRELNRLLTETTSGFLYVGLVIDSDLETGLDTLNKQHLGF